MIFFVDDEPYRMKFYLEEVEEGIPNMQSTILDSLDEAYVQIMANLPDVHLIIVDIMMPPRDTWNPEDVNDGLDSGIKFLGEVATELMTHRIPVIILTNRDVNKIEQGLASIKDKLYALEVYQKTQTPAWYLPNIVKKMLARRLGA